MKAFPNTKLTRNFHLYEFIEAQLPFEAVALNWKNISAFKMDLWERQALEIQRMRNMVNQNFKSDLGFDEIGIRILSGFRCREWELIRKRSGNSQHTICATDTQPTNCSRDQAIKINLWIHEQYKDWPGGLAIKHGSGDLVGFIHLDPREGRARWVYS
jgi:hypothetical protein